MKKFFSIGEALIDMIPSETGVMLKEVNGFTRTAGGAPANVCSCVSKQGIKASFIGMLGDDAFGDYLIDTINGVGINTDYIFRTDKANTSLAFVSLKKDGEREFSFYRKPGADMLLDKDMISENWFGEGDFLHFCSVDLIEAPVKYAHKKAIESVKAKNGVVVFDPNLRLALWQDKTELKKTVEEFSDYADIIKISDNELEFIFGTDDVQKAAKIMLDKGAKVFVYTMGSDGARVITKDIDVFCKAFKVDAIDATGAGDAFIGSFISQLIINEISIDSISEKQAEQILNYSNACGAIVATKHGAIQVMPDEQQVKVFIEEL